MLYGEVNRQRLKIISEHVVADTIDYLEARFAFSVDWDGLEKWVHFAKDGEVYDIQLTDDCIRKEDHLNLSAGIWKVYLHGNEFSGGRVIERITTNAAILKVEPTGTLDGEPFPEIPASETERINARLAKLEEGGTGGGIVQETDPTVPDWAKQPNPPTYTASEVGALPASTKIPAKTSDITNDSGFITRLVADLANYYPKSQTYTQSEVNALVSAIPKFTISVVVSLPTSDISETTVYLVKSGTDSDLYTEYIHVNGAWEILGSQKVDLTGYATETWVNTKLADYLPASQLQTAINIALAQAKASGEFDGAPGTSPTVAVSAITGGHRITITDKNGPKTVDVMDGADGDPGDPGKNGDPGRGILSVTRTSGTGAAGTTDTYTITYTDNTTSTFAVYNGKDGTPYVLTSADKTEIAQEAAGLVDVPDVDDTLKVSGAAADAAKVGTELSNLSEAIADLGAVPDYVKTEADEVLGRIINAQRNRTFNIACITDLHNNGGVSDSQITHACQGIKYIAERVKLDAFGCLGDHTDNTGTTDLADCLQDIKDCNSHKHKLVGLVDLFELIGNHDFIEVRSPKTNKLISAYSTDVVWGNANGGYFYKDYESYKLRVIGLNTSEISDVGVSAEQYRWFIEVLDLSTKENSSEWQILLLSHIPLDWHRFNVFSYVLNAYVNGTTWTDGAYSCDYTNKNKAKIIANVHGHIHNLLVDKMYLGNYTVSSEQINVWRIAIPEATELYSNHYDAPWKNETTYYKTVDTAKDTSFNVLCIDLDNHRISAICYGAGVDRTIDYTVFNESGGDDNTGSFTNVIDTVGYTDNTRLSTSTPGTTKGATGMVTTGIIDLSNATTPITLRTSGVDFSNSQSAMTSYDSSGMGKYAGYISGFVAGNYGGITAQIDSEGNLTVTLSQSAVGSDSWSKVQLCGYGIGENLIVTINEEIT